MSMQRFDDDWFHGARHRLLRRYVPSLIGEREVVSLQRGSVSQHLLSPADTERALARLAPRHAAAVRAHMQLYRAALETTALAPSDDLVQAAVQIEWFWYTTPFKQFYRDHLAHVMKVAATGLALLFEPSGVLVRNHEPAIEWVARGLASFQLGTRTLRQAARRLGVTDERLCDPAFWKEVVPAAVKVAGLLHDLAYPALMAARIARTARPMNALTPFQVDARDAAAKTIGTISESLVMTPFTGGDIAPHEIRSETFEVCVRVLEESHSLQAGAVFLEYRDTADRLWRLTAQEAFAIEWAALAASLHDYDKLYELKPGAKRSDATATLTKWLADNRNLQAIRPCFERDPVGYLVALADQLQDFGRLNYEIRSDGGPDAAPIRARYPWRSVSLAASPSSDAAKPPAAKITFEMGPDDSTCFGVSGSDRKKLADKKREAVAIFGPDGWLDHRGLFESVSIEVDY